MSLLGKTREITPQKALERLQRECSRREICEREALDKMRKWGVSSEISSKILSRLKKDRFIDDARFARSFALDRYRFSLYGRRKIAFLLRSKNIPSQIVEKALEEIDSVEYYRLLKESISRKIDGKLHRESSDDIDYQLIQKIMRQYVSRGYEPELIRRAIREI